MKKGQEIAVDCTNMEEMDHEISVDVELEERPSTSVNIYGSPVAPRGRRNEEPVEATFQAVPLANVNRVVSSVLLFPREYDRNLFPFFLSPFTIANVLYHHRLVPVRIRAAAKRPLKPLAVPVEMLR